MAFIEDKLCYRCKEWYRGTQKQVYCPKCSQIVNDEKIQEFLANWRGNLTLEERVAKIEKWIFEFQNHSHFSLHTPIG